MRQSHPHELDSMTPRERVGHPPTGEFGNLTNINVVSTAYNGCTQESLSVAATNNNQMTTFSYDGVGNVLNDTHNSYTWNDESQLKTAAGVTYTYDGDGERVQKSSGKIYWYGAGSEVLDESDASGNITDEYVYFGGKRISHRVVSTNALYFYGEDMLGTSRVIFTSAGVLCYDADFYPFGGERAYTNTCAQNYKFTGKERDSESNLDNFGARYNSSQMGRFMSPDPLGGKLTDPQTLNKYSYVRNNPITLTDPTGLYTVNCTEGAEKDQKKCNKAADNFEKQRLKDLNSKHDDVRGAAAAWGGPTDKNGITVTFKSQAQVDADAGNTDPNTKVGAMVGPVPNGSHTPEISAEFSESLGGSDLRQAIAHEGSHTEDDMLFLRSYDPSTGTYNGSLDFTHLTSEIWAYQIGAEVKPYSFYKSGDSVQQLTNFLTKNPVYRDYLNTPIGNPIIFPVSTVPQ